MRGRISRGVTERINAVLWFSDLRGSTAISESIAPDEIIPFLNDYAQAAIDAIHDAGGDVLKLIGDGVLAMFTGDDMALAKRAALRAEHRFRQNMIALNARRADRGRPTTSAYVGLHVGEVFYGNIGSEDRLDFTVVGPAVNEVSRIASMCRFGRSRAAGVVGISRPGSMRPGGAIWSPPAVLPCAASAARRISIRSIPTSRRASRSAGSYERYLAG